MRLFSFDDGGSTKVGLLQNDASFIDICKADPALPGDMRELLAMPDGLMKARTVAENPPPATVRAITEVRYMPVVPQPRKIVCMGLNYADHAKEGGNDRPEYPSFFLRSASSLAAHQHAIIRPMASTKLDYEAELAVIIGHKARHLTFDNALDCVAGYSCFNDASVRDYQRKTAQWTIGKNFDATGAFGPWLVTPDELPKACNGLRIQSRLNGKIMQDSNTSEFLWNVVEALVIITECMTLEPGDVIITGTPAGVGYARVPPVWMSPGDTCEVEIEGIGILSNSIADE